MKNIFIRKSRNEKKIFGIVSEIFQNAIPSFSENDVYFLACKGQEAIGFAHLVILEDRVLFQGLGVKEEYRRKGIGGRLVDTAVNFAERLGRDVYLKVKPSNVGALELYAKKGFTIKKLRNSYILQRNLCT
ncbi:GNAT family N-acetyltransferase [Candidatus Micrarchaeota archaeon]|nr:GNAT family N-acetyltransferase [Candidatus Micrarchaeota archaeon]MBD3417910.1 GNAT family N-acetyltransferase [Candidatus Micrarchaeota archaeon]